ncbi:MAG TPA: hypothetical protein VLS96_16345 [Nodosilinea sp.]|nr:hypothetical protein [Nodosilinea sp.]
MKPLHRRQRGHHQQGSIGGLPDQTPPALGDLMHQLTQLETRVQHFKTGLANLMQLQQLEANPPADSAQSTALDLVALQEAADQFETELANRVVSWEHLQEPFWQAVRFGGLGLLAGWVLAWLVYGR